MKTARLNLYAAILAGSGFVLLASSLALRFGVEAQRLMVAAAWFGTTIAIAFFVTLEISVARTPPQARARAVSL
jgi:hypothetical protein